MSNGFFWFDGYFKDNRIKEEFENGNNIKIEELIPYNNNDDFLTALVLGDKADCPFVITEFRMNYN